MIVIVVIQYVDLKVKCLPSVINNTNNIIESSRSSWKTKVIRTRAAIRDIHMQAVVLLDFKGKICHHVVVHQLQLIAAVHQLLVEF